ANRRGSARPHHGTDAEPSGRSLQRRVRAQGPLGMGEPRIPPVLPRLSDDAPDGASRRRLSLQRLRQQRRCARTPPTSEHPQPYPGGYAMTDEAQRIAKGLTEAQRDTLLALPDDQSWLHSYSLIACI